MTNGVLNATLSSNYANKMTQNSVKEQNSKSSVSQNKTVKQESKVEQLKAQISSGEYKVDIDALAKKMAEELRSF